MFIKICGITRLEDAQAAVEAGATALGFVFAPGKRQVSPETAAEIIAQAPPGIDTVGVFVNAPEAEVLHIARRVGLTCVQLHGDEPPGMCARLGRFFHVIKALKVSPDGRIQPNSAFPVWKILLDTALPGRFGGSGRCFDWGALESVDLDRVIVAGGLTPENVGRLLARFRPFGLDVSSGVESAPGIKNRHQMQRFVRAVQSHMIRSTP